MRWTRIPVAVALLAAGCSRSAAPSRPTQNVFVVTTDGLRWREVFEGAEERLIDKTTGRVERPGELRRRFWRDTPEARREALLPFFWTVLAKRGQVFRQARTTNGRNMSYPGYSELLTGVADPRIADNTPRANPNQSVLRWLHGQPGFAGRVAAFASWDVIWFVLGAETAGFLVNAGPVPVPVRGDLLDPLIAETTTPWDYLRFDSLTFRAATAFVEEHRPRVLYLGLGETDDWAHDGRYDRYLESAHRFDRYLATLWQGIESTPAYRGKTALVVTTDHGRGDPDWQTHGPTLPGSDVIWAAALGPQTDALGVRDQPVTAAQIAATVAALLGHDYAGAGAAPPIAGVAGR